MLYGRETLWSVNLSFGKSIYFSNHPLELPENISKTICNEVSWLCALGKPWEVVAGLPPTLRSDSCHREAAPHYLGREKSGKAKPATLSPSLSLSFFLDWLVLLKLFRFFSFILAPTWVIVLHLDQVLERGKPGTTATQHTSVRADSEAEGQDEGELVLHVLH